MSISATEFSLPQNETCFLMGLDRLRSRSGPCASLRAQLAGSLGWQPVCGICLYNPSFSSPDTAPPRGMRSQPGRNLENAETPLPVAERGTVDPGPLQGQGPPGTILSPGVPPPGYSGISCKSDLARAKTLKPFSHRHPMTQEKRRRHSGQNRARAQHILSNE